MLASVIHLRNLTIRKTGELLSFERLSSIWSVYITIYLVKVAEIMIRILENCAFTTQHDHPDAAQKHGAPASAGLGMPNGGLQVVNPSKALYNLILERMSSGAIDSYEFADQSLLGDLFNGRWVALPYIYNALKTLRSVHEPIWRDDEVKNIHYILSPKPWDERPGEESQETHKWWIKANLDRLTNERSSGIHDGF